MNRHHFTAFYKYLPIAAFAILFFSSPAQAVKYTQISAGGDHTCAVVSTGRIHCWGKNEYGQLGNGNTVDSTVPVIVSSISTATAVSAGARSTCAILASGGVRCWGSNVEGQLGNGSNAHSSLYPVTVNLNGAFARSISMGSGFACAAANEIYCWGFGGRGQLGNGQNASSSTPVRVLSALGVISGGAVSVGTTHACALRFDGSVRCWGGGTSGQLGDGLSADSNIAVAPTGLATATHVAAGNGFTCALLSSGGGGRCWGANSSGQLGNNSTTNSDTPVIVSRQSGLSIVPLNASLQLSASYRHVCVLRTTPEMLCWGENNDGQLGLGAGGPSQYNVAVPVTDIGVPVQLSAGTSHTCAVFPNGSAQCWGSNFFGQLGIGDDSNLDRPTPQWVVAPSCTFDIDDDGNVSALSDGLMILRAMLGMNGTAVTGGLVGASATRPTWPQIRAHLSTSCSLQGLAP